MESFRLSIKIKSMQDLISNCMKKEVRVVGKNAKDAHMNTIGGDLILLSLHKNAQVISKQNGGEVVAELNLKNREMSCSLVYENVLLIGTYVDTLFVFEIGSDNSFPPLFSIRSHDSILTMCVISPDHNFIALGQAAGHIDILKLRGAQHREGMLVSSI